MREPLSERLMQPVPDARGPVREIRIPATRVSRAEIAGKVLILLLGMTLSTLAYVFQAKEAGPKYYSGYCDASDDEVQKVCSCTVESSTYGDTAGQTLGALSQSALFLLCLYALISEVSCKPRPKDFATLFSGGVIAPGETVVDTEEEAITVSYREAAPRS